jgi:hypothetical protein
VWAFGVQASKNPAISKTFRRNFSERIGKNPTRRFELSTLANTYGISTCCALLRCFLGRLDGWES